MPFTVDGLTGCPVTMLVACFNDLIVAHMLLMQQVLAACCLDIPAFVTT